MLSGISSSTKNSKISDPRIINDRKNEEHVYRAPHFLEYMDYRHQALTHVLPSVPIVYAVFTPSGSHT